MMGIGSDTRKQKVNGEDQVILVFPVQYARSSLMSLCPPEAYFDNSLRTATHRLLLKRRSRKPLTTNR